MKFYACSQRGIGKFESEDRITIGRSVIAEGSFISEIDNGIVAIADGVGGNNAGAVASHFVSFRLSAENDITKELLKNINDELLAKSKASSQLYNMATTFSGIKLCDDNNVVFHVGNTRIYILQGGKYLKQLTEDDTTLNYLIASGQLSPEEADTFDRKNEIIACFGGGTPNLFKIKVSKMEFISSILLTSDGVHDFVNIDEMESIIEEKGITLNACEEMIITARKNGSKDDASVIIGGVR